MLMDQKKFFKVSMIVLFIGVFIFLAGYYSLNEYNKYAYKEAANFYNRGYTEAIYTIAIPAAKCQTVPLTINNSVIMNLVAVECLKNSTG